MTDSHGSVSSSDASDDAGGTGEVFAGVFIAFVASVGINVGNNIQAIGLKKMEAMKNREETTGTDEPSLQEMRRAKAMYGGGTALFFSSTFVVFGAMSLAPASILAPIESVQFVSNLAFARIVNKVAVSPAAIIASIVIVGGVAIAVGSGNHVNKSLGPAEIMEYWRDGRWIGYLVGLCVIAALAQLVWWVYDRRRRAVSTSRGADAPAATPLPYEGVVLPATYALSSSMIGSMTVVQAKCISELLETWSGGYQIWTDGATYLVLGIFVFTVVFWLYRLNSALGLYDPLFIIPAIQAGYIFWATLSAGVYFHDFDALADWQTGLFALGVSVMLGGLFVLSSASAKVAHAASAKVEAAAAAASPDAISCAADSRAWTEP